MCLGEAERSRARVCVCGYRGMGLRGMSVRGSFGLRMVVELYIVGQFGRIYMRCAVYAELFFF